MEKGEWEPNMIYCSNARCKRCYKDHKDNTVCILAEANFMPIGDHTEGYVLVCNNFMESNNSAVPKLAPEMNSDGLYPGQIGYR